MKQFDLCFTNPPYNYNMDLKIIKAIEPICNEIVAVHPATWAIDLKHKAKLYNNFKKQMKGKIKEVEMFNGNPVFNVGLNVPCMITHIIQKHSGKIKVKYFDDQFETTNLDDITKFGTNWKNIVQPFHKQMKQYTKQYQSIWDKHTFKINTKLFHCQFAGIMGTREKILHNKMVKDDYYTMIMKKENNNKGIRQNKIRGNTGTITPTFEFNTEKERNNFIQYAKTHFARFCMAIYKNSQSTYAGELNLIPWLDFTKVWNDQKLFKYFNINTQTQKYILEYIPDYYNLLNNHSK